MEVGTGNHMISKKIIHKYYPPELCDYDKKFYDWIRSSLNKTDAVLNVGSGRYSQKRVMSLKGEAEVVYGVDIDPEVLNNPDLDRAYVIHADQKWPFPDNHFDLVWSDYVLEHIENPLLTLKEIHRTLKKGGMFFFRTPNKYHYVALIARVTPHWFHVLVANRARGLKSDTQEFPYRTFYRLNSERDIRSLAVQIRFQSIEIKMIETYPCYLVFHAVPFYMGVAYERIVNHFEFLKGLRINLLGRLVK